MLYLHPARQLNPFQEVKSVPYSCGTQSRLSNRSDYHLTSDVLLIRNLGSYFSIVIRMRVFVFHV